MASRQEVEVEEEEGILMDFKPAAFFVGGAALDDAAAAVQTETIGRVLGPQLLQREERKAAGGAEREASIEIGKTLARDAALAFSVFRRKKKKDEGSSWFSPSVSFS